jgi:hypothetical protein
MAEFVEQVGGAPRMYFTRPNSVVFRHAVHKRRTAYGLVFAKESPAPGSWSCVALCFLRHKRHGS